MVASAKQLTLTLTCEVNQFGQRDKEEIICYKTMSGNMVQIHVCTVHSEVWLSLCISVSVYGEQCGQFHIKDLVSLHHFPTFNTSKTTSKLAFSYLALFLHSFFFTNSHLNSLCSTCFFLLLRPTQPQSLSVPDICHWPDTSSSRFKIKLIITTRSIGQNDSCCPLAVYKNKII